MAAAEARAAWQRMANRCIVQEDAKRAPKLACYPSSGSQFQPDPTAGNMANKADQPPSTFIPPCWSPAEASQLPPDAKWWLHVQPNLGPMTVDPTALILEDDPKVKSGSEPGPLKGVDPLTPLEPWWRISDMDELALFVAQRSLECVENCDLPPPQRVHLCPTHRTVGAASRIGGRRSEEFDREGLTDQARVDLLEALRRSQTRAREAEMAAQRAHIEKERIMDLFLKQASSLFAYRQWVQMLQLESLFLRAKMRDPQSKTNPRPKRSLYESAVAMAVSVGLAAAGVLFGWTLGWLLPIF